MAVQPKRPARTTQGDPVASGFSPQFETQTSNLGTNPAANEYSESGLPLVAPLVRTQARTEAASLQRLAESSSASEHQRPN
ncbi:unannotated protein [freshwater metagenome]|uniref:Unannotated protein n=1 Tax=freshwater metagenome TaxID=449393 RepID=A0A6J7NJS0_9ZZZZ